MKIHLIGSALLSACILSSTILPAAEAPQTADTSAVIHTVEELFAAMATRDESKLRKLLSSEALVINTDERKGPSFTRTRTADAFIKGIVDSTDVLKERMWNPEVRIDGNIAALWAPYEFHRNGELSHCGHDAVHLIRQDGQWRITALSYTAYAAPACKPGAANRH